MVISVIIFSFLLRQRLHKYHLITARKALLFFWSNFSIGTSSPSIEIRKLFNLFLVKYLPVYTLYTFTSGLHAEMVSYWVSLLFADSFKARYLLILIFDSIAKFTCLADNGGLCASDWQNRARGNSRSRYFLLYWSWHGIIISFLVFVILVNYVYHNVVFINLFAANCSLLWHR